VDTPTQQPDSARPPPEPWDEPERQRPIWAPYDLPNSAIRMIEGEQLLQQLGVRDIVAGLASASASDFQNGITKLKAVFVTQYKDGFDDGLHTQRDGIGIRTMLGGIVIGAAGACMIAAVLWNLLT